ncbi:MAG: hypothetical protein ACP5KJ_03295 [Candidatus Micrarchaeia archaeon]
MNTGTAPKCLRGQGSAEFLLILAAALFVIAVSFYISSQQFTSVSQSKNVNDATLTADSIASAANEVYFQGYGARKRLLITIPQGVNTSGTYIAGNSIVITTDGTTVVSQTEVPVHGTLPLKPGQYYVWVVSEGSSVRIGNVFVSVTPGALFFMLDEAESDSGTLKVTNVFDQGINVSLYAEWPHSSDVSLSISPSNFSLNPDQERDVTIEVISYTGSAGIYDGNIVINATDGDDYDQVYIPITVYVLAPPGGNATLPLFYVSPNTWNQTVQRGATVNKYFYVCTLGISVNQVTFTPSGTVGSWVWNTGPIGPIPPYSCLGKVFYITVPGTQPVGNYTGTILASADGGAYTYPINLSIEVIAPVDTQGPLASNVVVRANTPNPSGVIHAYQDDVIVNATCSDVGRGNSNILYGELSSTQASCGWVQMLPRDGAYDSPVEDVTGNLGRFAEGDYFALVRCTDIYYNTGSTVSQWFGVAPPDYKGPAVTSFWLEPSNNPGMSQYITVHAWCDDWGSGDSIISAAYVEIDFNGTWIPLKPEDGAYDEPDEGVAGGIGYLYAGQHTATIYCKDYYNNTGARNYTFLVTDDIGPLALNLYITPFNPTPSTPITAHATGNDTGRGDSNINLCRARVDAGIWRNMYADDGAYDEPVEQVNRNMGTYESGFHTLYVQCRQTVGNIWGPINSKTFRVS